MKKYIPILTILFMLIAIACTKYKEDEFISFHKPEKRLLGNWKIVAFEVDGADSLSNLYTYADFSNCVFKFERDEGNSVNKIEGCVDVWEGAWWIDKKSFNVRNYFVYPNIIRFPNFFYIAPAIAEFQIFKLYKNDFWIQKEFQGKTYIIKFKKESVKMIV